MSNMPFKDAIPLAGSVQPIAREYSQFLFNTGYSPLSPLKGAAIAQSMQKKIKHVLVFLHFHKGTVHNSLQKAGLSSRCMIFSKKIVQDTAVFSGSTFLKFQMRFHAQSVLIPCKCTTFFQQGNAFKAKYRLCLEKV